MIAALLPSFLDLNHLMSSQSGNLHDLAAYSGHPSSFIIGSEPEPDSSSRQEYPSHHRPPAPNEMGLRYMTIPNPDDARFNSDTRPPHSPVYTVDAASLSASTTSIPFSSFPNVFASSLTGTPSYPNSGVSYFTPNAANYCVPDIKPTLAFLNSPGDMAPSTRSPHITHVGSPGTARELYASATPQLRRTSELSTRSPPPSESQRGIPLSPSSSSGFASPSNMDNSQLGNGPNGPPPLQPTEVMFQLQTSEGQPVRPEILGKIDKGFFLAEGDWTCYRRNYFQLSCSYTLHPYPVSSAMLHLVQGGSSLQIHAFAMSIAAVVDGHDGRPIDLVQHTPKRDKGPQDTPPRVTLLPRPHPTISIGYGNRNSEGLIGSESRFEPTYLQNAGQPPTEHTFERIQFKYATANNGKRRAAQQYYHLLVELFADVGPQMGEGRWVKVAHRISAQMVVRGRSPGHYHTERRGSNTSTGPGGSTGQGGGTSAYNSTGGITRGQSDQMSLSGSSSMLTSGAYGPSYDTRTHNYLSDLPMEPLMSAEESKAITEAEGYHYFPHPIYEPNISSGNRPPGGSVSVHLNSRDDRGSLPVLDYPYGGSTKVKQEYQHQGISLPSLTTGPSDAFGRHCGRFEGIPTSRGYYPTQLWPHPEIGST